LETGEKGAKEEEGTNVMCVEITTPKWYIRLCMYVTCCCTCFWIELQKRERDKGRIFESVHGRWIGWRQWMGLLRRLYPPPFFLDWKIISSFFLLL